MRNRVQVAQGDLGWPWSSWLVLRAALSQGWMWDRTPGLVKLPEEEEEKLYPSVMLKSGWTMEVVCPPWVLLHFPRELQVVTQVTQVAVRATSWASSCGSWAAASVSPAPVLCPPCCSCRCSRIQEQEEPLISAAACLASSCVPGASRDACRDAGAGRDEIRGSRCEGAVPALPAVPPAHRLCQSRIQSGLCWSCSSPSFLPLVPGDEGMAWACSTGSGVP